MSFVYFRSSFIGRGRGVVGVRGRCGGVGKGLGRLVVIVVLGSFRLFFGRLVRLVRFVGSWG